MMPEIGDLIEMEQVLYNDDGSIHTQMVVAVIRWMYQGGDVEVTFLDGTYGTYYAPTKKLMILIKRFTLFFPGA